MPTNDINLTPAMIAAGAVVVDSFEPNGLSRSMAQCRAREIFEAMLQAAHAPTTTITATYVVDPAVVLERIRALTFRADAIKPSYLPIMLTTFGKNWAAVADALKLRVEHENPMRALDLLEVEIARRETSEDNLARTLGLESVP